jgi:RNA polymerase sigma-70 factor (ECF subfamily)
LFYGVGQSAGPGDRPPYLRYGNRPYIIHEWDRLMWGHDDLKVWFGQRIEEHLDALYSFALRLTRNAADAEDLVADSVTKAWSAIASLDDRNRFRPWMLRIVHNRFISDYRKKAVRPIEVTFEELSVYGDGDDIEPLLLQQPEEFLAWWANPEQAFVNILLGEDIIAALERLPEAFRIVVLLINVEGLSYDEAAQVLDVSPGTIRSRMNRGRTLLQRELWEHAKEAGLVTETAMERSNP